jgi:hypothetical protein
VLCSLIGDDYNASLRLGFCLSSSVVCFFLDDAAGNGNTQSKLWRGVRVMADVCRDAGDRGSPPSYE